MSLVHLKANNRFKKDFDDFTFGDFQSVSTEFQDSKKLGVKGGNNNQETNQNENAESFAFQETPKNFFFGGDEESASLPALETSSDVSFLKNPFVETPNEKVGRESEDLVSTNKNPLVDQFLGMSPEFDSANTSEKTDVLISKENVEATPKTEEIKSSDQEAEVSGETKVIQFPFSAEKFAVVSSPETIQKNEQIFSSTPPNSNDQIQSGNENFFSAFGSFNQATHAENLGEINLKENEKNKQTKEMEQEEDKTEDFGFGDFQAASLGEFDFAKTFEHNRSSNGSNEGDKVAGQIIQESESVDNEKNSLFGGSLFQDSNEKKNEQEGDLLEDPFVSSQNNLISQHIPTQNEPQSESSLTSPSFFEEPKISLQPKIERKFSSFKENGPIMSSPETMQNKNEQIFSSTPPKLQRPNSKRK